MMSLNWIQRKWCPDDPIITDELYKRVVELEEQVRVLKEENIENTNLIYEILENIRDLDARIDILREEPKDV